MSRDEEYYANFGAQTVDEYVEMGILNSPTEMQRFAATLAIIPKDTVTLLDVGCGPGVFLHLLRDKLGIEGVGIEITEAKVEYARRVLKVDVRLGRADQLPFPDMSFDTVTALEVIEHLPYKAYETALEEFERVAKKWIVVSVPYQEKRTFTRCPYCATRFNGNYHIRSFDEGKLANLFPNFRLVTLAKYGEYVRLYNPFRSLVAWLRPPAFPTYAVCPACGFHRSALHTDPLGCASDSVSKARYMRWLTTLIPKQRQHRWGMSVYERI